MCIRDRNTWITARERVSSMVNAVRSQSQLAPSLRSCLRMMPPVSYTHLDVYKRQDMASWLKQYLQLQPKSI